MTRDALEYRDVINRIASAMMAFLVIFSVLNNITFYITIALSYTLTPTAATIAGGLLELFAYLFSFILPGLFFRWISRKKKHTLKSLQAGIAVPKTMPLLIIAGVAINSCFSFINAVFLKVIGYAPIVDSYEEYAYSSVEGFEFVIMFISIAVVPAFCEEFLFRGIIMRHLVPYGKVTAVVISSLLFALMHQNPAQFLYTFFSGVVLALVCIETGSIWCSVFIHLFNNGFAVFDDIVAMQLSNSAASYIISLLDGIICVGGIVSIIILVKLYDKKKEENKECLDGGFFGKRLEQSYSYAPKKLSTSEKIELFCTPLMLAFCIIAVLTSF